MNRDDIIRMAREAGFRIDHEGEVLEGDDWHIQTDAVECLAYSAFTAGALAEREACIKLLEDFSQTKMVPVKDTWRMGLIAGANAIRARGHG